MEWHSVSHSHKYRHTLSHNERECVWEREREQQRENEMKTETFGRFYNKQQSRQCIEIHFQVKRKETIAAKRFAMFASEIGCFGECCAAMLRWWIGSQIGFVCVINRCSFVCSYIRLLILAHWVEQAFSPTLSLLLSPSFTMIALTQAAVLYLLLFFLMQCNCPFGCFW